jgi:hypothetical protein
MVNHSSPAANAHQRSIMRGCDVCLAAPSLLVAWICFVRQGTEALKHTSAKCILSPVQRHWPSGRSSLLPQRQVASALDYARIRGLLNGRLLLRTLVHGSRFVFCAQENCDLCSEVRLPETIGGAGGKWLQLKNVNVFRDGAA